MTDAQFSERINEERKEAISFRKAPKYKGVMVLLTKSSAGLCWAMFSIVVRGVVVGRRHVSRNFSLKIFLLMESIRRKKKR